MALLCLAAGDPAALTEEVCEGDTFTALCADNEVIVMQTALYGRMASSHCVYDVDTSCETNVLLLLDSKVRPKPQTLSINGFCVITLLQQVNFAHESSISISFIVI